MKTLKNIGMTIALGTTLAAISMPAATIYQRRENQQGRIAQGVGSGQLTARETGHIESQEARLNSRIREDRAVHGGHLTGFERGRIDARQNHLSNEIYRDKHNAFHQ
jgi:hypothetical protein